jgi:UDP-N-acetylmuramoyl-L-alanyl-D-glutamate--2,6-diaminopimelate ligase
VSAGPRPSTTPRPLAEVAAVAGATVRGGGSAAPDPDVTGVTHDSRGVVPGDLYAALPGFRTHGAEFVGPAVAAGAVAVLTDPAGADRALAAGVPVLVAEDPRAVLGAVASWVYGDPSRDLTVVGITGTNGKTTTSYLLDAGLRAAGHTTGVIGTVGTRIGEEVVATVRTTPEATDLHALLAVMRDRGVTAVTMEVSSHALRLGRVDGVRFTVVGFTNLSPDHLDFHTDMDDYLDAKASLFTAGRAGSAVVCVDDTWGERIAAHAVAQGLPVSTYAITRGDADWSVDRIVSVRGGSVTRAHVPAGAGDDDVALEVRLPGAFNVANALGALALLARVGVAPGVAAAGIAACAGVPGRMERVPDPDPERGLLALVDYAHTPDAVERAIAAAREGSRGRLLVVFGAGGDRDPHKRPAMGEAAARGADVVWVTDDNPRSEDPAAIRSVILAAARRVSDVPVHDVGDRRGAIRLAVVDARPGDVVLVLGKGHEQGQEVAGVVTPFDDRVVLAAELAASHGADAVPDGDGGGS